MCEHSQVGNDVWEILPMLQSSTMLEHMELNVFQNYAILCKTMQWKLKYVEIHITYSVSVWS